MSGGSTNTKNTPVEALERTFPLRVLRYRLGRGVGAPDSTLAATVGSALRQRRTPCPVAELSHEHRVSSHCSASRLHKTP